MAQCRRRCSALDANSQRAERRLRQYRQRQHHRLQGRQRDRSRRCSLRRSGSGDVSSAGVTANMTQNVAQQGLLQTTTSPTDLAISGNGFFVVNTAASAPGSANSLYYTRAGNFTPDANGNLQNASGYYLMGWALDSTGNVPSDRNDMSTININALSGKANPTTYDQLQGQSAVQHGDQLDLYRRRHGSGHRDAGLPAHRSTSMTARAARSRCRSPSSRPAPTSGPTKSAIRAMSPTSAARPTIRSMRGTMTFNTDGTLANADTTDLAGDRSHLARPCPGPRSPA